MLLERSTEAIYCFVARRIQLRRLHVIFVYGTLDLFLRDSEE